MKIKVKSSIHIKKANVYFILHSVRANDSYSKVFTDEQNEYLYNKDTALKLFRNELKKRELAYQKRTGKKLPKNTATLLSAIVNLNKEHTLEDVKKIAEYLEKTLDTKVVSVAIHRDEGKLVNKITGEEFYSGIDFIRNEFDDKLYWIDENKKLKEEVNLEEFEIVKNYHAHLEFMGLDSNGVAIKRNKLSKYYLSKLQDVVAETLKMERGFNYYKTQTKAKKRLDVAEFKKAGVTKRKAKKEVLAKVKDLKEENKRIREKFKQLGAVREDYAKLEQLVRKLKEKIKAKELTLQEMQEKFDKQLEELEIKLKEEQEKNKQLDNENGELDRENYALINELYEEKRKNEELESMIRGFFEPEVSRTREENEQLKEENKQLEKELIQSDNRVQELEEENKELRKELNYITTPVKNKEEFKDIVVENSILLYELNTKTNRIENTCDKVEWEEWHSVLSEIKPIEKENKKTKEELEETKNINKQLKEKIDYFEFWDNKNELIERGYIAKIISYRLKLIEKRLQIFEEKLKELINKAIQKLENTDHDKANYMKKAFSKFLNNSSYSENSGNKVSNNWKIKR